MVTPYERRRRRRRLKRLAFLAVLVIAIGTIAEMTGAGDLAATYIERIDVQFTR